MADPIFLDPSWFFAPQNRSTWSAVGNVASFSQVQNQINLVAAGGGPAPQITVLSPTVFRVRFNRNGQYDVRTPYDPGDLTNSADPSYAVITQDLGIPSVINVAENGSTINLDTGRLIVQISKNPYSLAVFRGGQQIHTDSPLGIQYVWDSVVNFKQRNVDAFYYGFGEKAGPSLEKSGKSLTFFNYDNFSYSFGPREPGDPLYISIPILIETQPDPTVSPPYSYAIFLDNPSQTYFDTGSPDRDPRQYYFGAVFGDLNYYFIYGDAVAEIIQQYTTLTGRMPMPPKYVFGYHQGCYGYNVDVGNSSPLAADRQNVLDVAKKYRGQLGGQAPIPCDGLHLDVDFQHDYRMFTAGPSSFRPNVQFGDPVALIKQLHDLGFKCSTNITAIIRDDKGVDKLGHADPYLVRDLGFRNPPGVVFLRDPNNPNDFYKGSVDYGLNPLEPNDNGKDNLGTPGFYPDLTLPVAQQWWINNYQSLLESVQIDMIWQDETCPGLAEPQSGENFKTLPPDVVQFDYGRNRQHVQLHNAYAQTMLRGTTAALNQIQPQKRGFIIARGGYAGLQRYAGVWTGDSTSSWEHLQMNIPMVLNLGLSGVPIAGSDIGGFATSGEDIGSAAPGKLPVAEDELVIRWMTLGAFLPWYRNHYDSYSKAFQEPFNYADPAFTANPNSDVPKICRKYIQIRYQLLQYIYDCMWVSHNSGLPVARPIFLNDPTDLHAYDRLASSTEFCIGDNVLVAPQTYQGVSTRNVYLPAGNLWFPFPEAGPLAAAIAGGQTPGPVITTPLDFVPVFIRAGAIVPMRQLEQWVGQLPQCPLTFDIYPGPDSTYQLYQDDGLTTDFAAKNAYRLTTISQSQRVGQYRVQTVQVQRTFDNFTPPETFYFIGLLSTPSPNSVTANGQTLPIVQAGSDNDSANALAASTVNACYYNQSLKTTFIKIFDVAPNTPINPSTPDMVVVATFPPTVP
jgi:alpha-glucosidase